MKKLVPIILAVVLLGGCSKKSDPSPAAVPVLNTFAPVAGVFTIQPNGGAAYTVTKLALRVTEVLDAAGHPIYYTYTYQGGSSEGDDVEVIVALLDPIASLTAAGPWRAQMVLHHGTRPTFYNFTASDLGYGTLSSPASNAYTASWSSAVLAGSLK